MGKKCAIDPEFQSLIPRLSSDEFAALEASILADGCLHALVTWKGLLIDGHHRREICMKHSKPYRVVERNFGTREEVLVWIINNQLARRNLSDYDRGELALKQKNIIAARGKANQAHGQTGPGVTLLLNSSKASAFDTRKEIAALAGVSPSTIAQIEKIQDNAVPAVVAAVKSREISINAAAQIASLPEDEQQIAAAGGKEAMKRAAKASRTVKSPMAAAKQSALIAPDEMLNVVVAEPAVTTPVIEATSDMPAILQGYDFSKDVSSDADMLAVAQQEIEILHAQLEAFQESDRAAELEKQIRMRFGFEQQNTGNMTKVAQLDKELRHFGKLFAELRKILKADTNADVLTAVRALVKEPV